MADEFDLSSLDPEVAENVSKVIEQQVAEQVSGLKRNNGELTGELRKAREQSQQLKEQSDQIKSALGDFDLDEVRELIEARNKGEIDKLIDQKDIDKAFELKLKRERSEWQKQLDQQVGELKQSQEAVAAERDKAVEQLKSLRLGDRSKSVFRQIPNHDPQAESVVAREVRDTFTFDENNEPVALDEYGDVRTDPKGNPLTIEYFVTEMLPESMPFLFKEAQGAGARGSGAGGRSADLGVGISQRKGVPSDKRAEFFNRARQKGITDLDAAWERIPYENAAA